MSLADIIQVTITAATATPTKAGFGTPMIAAAHDQTGVVTGPFKNVKAMTDFGFPTIDPAVLIATKIFSQNPRVTEVKVGKRVNKFTQKLEIVPINVDEFFKYEFVIVSPDQTTKTTISRVNGGAETVASIVTALTTLITAISGLTAVDGTTKVTCTADVTAELFDYQGFDEPANFTIQDVTVDPGLAADLAAIEAADPLGWYALCLDSNSESEILVAATFIEARSKIFLTNTTDSEVVDNGVSDDIMSQLKTGAFARTAIIYSQNRLLNFTGAAWLGERLPSDPGSSTWNFKTLAAVFVDDLTGAEQSEIIGKGGNHYVPVAGINITQNGVTASGEFIDITRFRDFLEARLQERIFKALADNDKIPFTDSGVDVIRAVVEGVLELGIDVGGIAPDPAPTVTFPKVADIDVSDKAARKLPDGEFEATLAGAIHSIVLSGRLLV